MHRTRFRRIAAIATAYVLALHAMFSAFAMPSQGLAGVEAGIICQPVRTGVPEHPAAHDPCCPCLAGHCADAAGNTDRVAVVVPWPAVAVAADTPVRFLASAALRPRERPHSPRAPPVA